MPRVESFAQGGCSGGSITSQTGLKLALNHSLLGPVLGCLTCQGLQRASDPGHSLHQYRDHLDLLLQGQAPSSPSHVFALGILIPSHSTQSSLNNVTRSLTRLQSLRKSTLGLMTIPSLNQSIQSLNSTHSLRNSHLGLQYILSSKKYHCTLKNTIFSQRFPREDLPCTSVLGQPLMPNNHINHQASLMTFFKGLHRPRLMNTRQLNQRDLKNRQKPLTTEVLHLSQSAKLTCASLLAQLVSATPSTLTRTWTK